MTASDPSPMDALPCNSPLSPRENLARPAELPPCLQPVAAGSRPSIADLEQQIDQLKQQLYQAQKLTALGELVSTTTHEFNNVLTTIINYAKMGQRHHDAPTRDKAFEKILGAGLRAAKITSNILGFARNRTQGIEATDVVRLVEDALLLLEREMMKYRVQVETHFSTTPPALVNGNQIQQVLLNLLVNARQAMPHGGQIVVRTLFDAATGMVEVTVRDSGSGIPADKLPHIFDRFFTTKSGPDDSGKGGTGLGLAFCRDVIEAHQGRIRVESTVGKGTAVTLKLPSVRKTEPIAVPQTMSIAAPITMPASGVQTPSAHATN